MAIHPVLLYKLGVRCKKTKKVFDFITAHTYIMYAIVQYTYEQLRKEQIMPTVCHFEIPADDPSRARSFYEKLFDWKFQSFPEMDYQGITTGPEGKSVPGGMMKRMHPNHTITVYYDVTDVAAYGEKIKKLGGQVIMEKTAVPGRGWFAVCMDTENNPFGLWQIDKSAE
jgi:predicted enzyme related to lactoylglutathione lyase